MLPSRAMGDPARGAIAKCSPARSSPPPGGAMVAPPAIGVCQSKERPKRRPPVDAIVSVRSLTPVDAMVPLPAIDQNNNRPKPGSPVEVIGSLPHRSLTPVDVMVPLPPIDRNKNRPVSLELACDKKTLQTHAAAIFLRTSPKLSPAGLSTDKLSLLHCKASEGLGKCVICHQEINTSVCNRCATCLKVSLVEVNLDAALRSTAGAGRLSFCLSCGELVRGVHEQHQTQVIPLRPYRKSWAAWDNGYQNWSSLFQDVQAQQSEDLDAERPFLLKPLPGGRCEVCSDLVAPPTLFGTLIRYCTVECWLRSSDGAAGHLEWAAALVGHDFRGSRANAFCITCACGFLRGAPCHDGHLVFSVVADGLHSNRPLLHIPAGHSVARALDSVKDWAGGEVHSSTLRQLVVKDHVTRRCRRCNVRLNDDDGDTCCLECALPLQKKFVPRSLSLRMQKGQARA